MYSLPLLANEKVLIDIHAVIQLNSLIKLDPSLILRRHLLRCRIKLLHCSTPYFTFPAYRS